VGDHRTTHSFAACCSAFFWIPHTAHHARSTARFWQNHFVSPQMRSRARRNAAPARLLPDNVREERGVSDRILNEWCAPFVSSGSIERMVCDEYWGCGRADRGLSFFPATRCGLWRRGGGGRRKAAAAKWGIFQRNSGRSCSEIAAAKSEMLAAGAGLRLQDTNLKLADT